LRAPAEKKKLSINLEGEHSAEEKDRLNGEILKTVQDYFAE
jgi:hypothetical protein